MRTLYLHLGPSKSGSTYLQTSFELSRDALREGGIDYPALSAGEAFRGEGAGLFGNYHDLYADIRRAAGADAHLLISGESLPDHLRDLGGIDLLDRVRREAGFDRMACLLVLRDPVDHATSEYQQAVKHARETATAAAWFRGYHAPTTALRLVRELHALGAEVTLRRYAAVSDGLVDLAERWLDLVPGQLQRPQVERINPSLSADELELQRSLNLADARAPLAAEAMVERLPDLRRRRFVPSEEAQRALLDRLAPDLDALDALLPEGEALSCELLEPYGEQGGDVTLSAEQLAVLAEVLAASRDRRPAPGRFARAGIVVRRLGGRRTQPPGSVVASALAAEAASSLGVWRRTEATTLLAAASIWRRSVPMRHWAGVLGSRSVAHSPLPVPTRLEGEEHEVSRAIRAAVAALPFTPSCLDQAVAGSLLLKRRGLAATVVVGLSTTNPRNAHAWLLGPSGEVLTGGVVAAGFVPVTEFHRSAG